MIIIRPLSHRSAGHHGPGPALRAVQQAGLLPLPLTLRGSSDPPSPPCQDTIWIKCCVQGSYQFSAGESLLSGLEMYFDVLKYSAESPVAIFATTCLRWPMALTEH
jgi:hypothetical protein